MRADRPDPPHPGRALTVVIRGVHRPAPYVLLSVLLAGVPQATATVIVPVPDDVLADQAVAIVVGHVTAMESYWDPQQGQIFTHIALAFDEALKGELPFTELTLEQVGGAVGDLRSWVFGGAEFVRGERVLLFLRLNADRTLRVAHQPVERDSHRKRPVLFQDPRGGYRLQ